MKLLKAIAPITLLVAASWTAPVIAGEISGRQYLMLGAGSTPIADNEIYSVPCSPINRGCIEIKTQLLKDVSTLVTPLLELHRPGGDFDKINRTIRKSAGELAGTSMAKQLSHYKGFNVTHSNFEGKYSLNCPTQNCLVYSSVSTPYVQGFWVDVVSSGSEHDITGSNAKTIYNLDD